MSSGAKIRLYACEEAVLGTTPANPIWYTVRRVTDGLSENVSTEESSEVVDSRYRQGGVVTEAEIPGKGYRTQNDRYGSPLSGDQRGTKSTNDGTWNWQYHGRTEGQPGAGGAAIIGIAPLITQLINEGRILQTL